jgi:hypothetical protein
MYKRLFILLFDLVVHPEKTWKELREEQESANNENFYKSYLYPIIGIIALFAFLGILFSLKKVSIKIGCEIALKMVIKEAVSYFAAFWIVAFCLFKIIPKYFGKEIGMPVCERFTGYASAAVYAVAMVYTLLPSLIFIQIFILYAIYTVWTGAMHYLEISEEYLIKFTIFAGSLILFSPVLIRRILSLMMPGL